MEKNILEMNDILKEMYKLNDEEERCLKNIFTGRWKYEDIQVLDTLFKDFNEELIKYEVDIDRVENDIYTIQDELTDYEKILETENSEEEIDWICNIYSMLQILLKEKMKHFKLQSKLQRGVERLIMLLISFFEPYLETYFTEIQLKERFSGFEFNYISEFIFIENKKELCK